jgi:hypothetical protein
MSDLKFLGYRVPKIDFSIGDQFGSGPVQLDVNIKRSVEDEQHLQDKVEPAIHLFSPPLSEMKTTIMEFVQKSL